MKYFKYLFFIMVLASASSCKKFLDTKPSDFLAPETFYATDAQLISALAAVYDPLGWETMYGNNLFSNLTIATDESFWNRSAQTTGTQVYSFDYAHADVSGLWAACYTGIERANILIANINKPEMDETKRQDILGQALFLRGYYYFLLASNFGGAPLKLVPQPSVSDAVNILKFILSLTIVLNIRNTQYILFQRISHKKPCRSTNPDIVIFILVKYVYIMK